jgi:hypothetical protein
MPVVMICIKTFQKLVPVVPSERRRQGTTFDYDPIPLPLRFYLDITEEWSAGL